MKKILTTLLLGLTISTSYASCIAPTRKEIVLLSATAYSQQYEKMNMLLEKYCYDFRPEDVKTNTPLILNSSAKGLMLIQSKTDKTYANMPIDHNKMDLFSIVLINGAMISDRVKKETISDVKKVITQNYNIDISKINDDFINKSRKDLLDILAKDYAKNSSPNKDKMKNTALTYVIANNYPEYLEQSLGRLREKEMFIQINGKGVNPLHIAFSPLLKSKNTEELSKKLINMVPVSYMINNIIWNYDYFQFAEAFKENNPTFYKMLKEKYKFEVTKFMDPKIKEEINKSLKLYWEIDDTL